MSLLSRHYGLEKGGNCDRIVDTRRDIANTKLERGKYGWGGCPTDLFTIVDAPVLTASRRIAESYCTSRNDRDIVLGNSLKTSVRYDLSPVLCPIQKRDEVEGKHVWQEIAGSIHDVDSPFPIGHSYVNVSPKINSERATVCSSWISNSYRSSSNIFDPANVKSDEWRPQPLPGHFWSPVRDDASQPCNIGARFPDIYRPRADLHHRLDHLGLDLSPSSILPSSVSQPRESVVHGCRDPRSETFFNPKVN